MFSSANTSLISKKKKKKKCHYLNTQKYNNIYYKFSIWKQLKSAKHNRQSLSLNIITYSEGTF